jgi:hypothetical protein
VTAWAFGAAGLSATQGLTIAVVYGVFAFVAALPGALVLLARGLQRVRARATPVEPVTTLEPVMAAGRAVTAGPVAASGPVGTAGPVVIPAHRRPLALARSGA